MKSLSGKHIEIWHTSVVVYGKEIFYGSHGISYCEPYPAEMESTSLGSALKPALNALAVGLNRAPDKDHAGRNKHSFEIIRKQFHPIIFDVSILFPVIARGRVLQRSRIQNYLYLIFYRSAVV
ncbi:hypothetical protein FGIG_12416 [Fasciola gigantica]|uniref:Uncharacterized protein n=1 Tax=Fasciola gigantica TaxID=46835 RepID=A0A504Y8B1_FASGI|nr:hypothetical protein FGIG_12416 [Fasciola gigantica]